MQATRSPVCRSVPGHLKENRSMSPYRHILAAAAVCGLVGAGAVLHSGSTPAFAAPSQLTDSSIPDVAERAVESVVNISSTSVEAGPAAFDPFFNDDDS